MKRRVLVIVIIIALVMGCTITKKSQQEGQVSPKEAISVDVTGLNAEQQEAANNMINEIVPLIREGKTESQVIQFLQEQDAKKITRYRVEVGDAPIKGPDDAKVTIVEFTDFQCPFCAKVQPTLTKIFEKYPQDVKKVFKQHPLSFHKDAPLAAEASLAAGAQGKFWEMKEVLFNNQKKLKEEQLIQYAQELGLDLEQFKSDLSTHKYKAQVERETQEAVKLGATGTPAFFVNGRYLSGAKPLESFVKVIDEELSGKKIPFKWGTNVKNERKQAQKRQRPAEDPNKIYTIPTGSSPFKGPQDAPVTVVMFQDFQCPFSNRSLPTVKQLMELYPGKLKLVFKNFPLNFHKQAEIAAEAALAAGSQGKFWEMHDKIFAKQKEINLDNLKIYAQELNLDMNKFNQDLETHRYKKTVEEDMKTAKGAGVRGTPTFFINGKKLVGAKPVTEFQKIIDKIK
jgi:protein-disulfide isomerase